MKFFVGYQMRKDDSFLDEIIACKQHIGEVYFSWGSYANGRNSQLRQSGLTPWEAQTKQEQDLMQLAKVGIPMNLLFNAMCYGKDSQSRAFFEGIGNTVVYLKEKLQVSSITTTSLLIAKFLKNNFSDIEVRASVNMSIGTVEGMAYIQQYYDSFYLQRELNRDFGAIRNLKAWCDDHGKKLYILANSGCLNYCSAHVFHDNLVAHEAEISQMDNGYAFTGVCGEYLKDPGNYRALIDNTSFIRPEDVHLYEDLVPAMKLATRANADPVRVLRSYVGGRHSGSTLALLEPNHTALLYPRLLENAKLNAQIKDDRLILTNFENAIIQLEEKIYANE